MLQVINIALPTILRQSFDYLSLGQHQGIEVGARVRVPFRNKQLIGFYLGSSAGSDIPSSKLKPLIELIDEVSLFTDSVFKCCNWASLYYQYSFGEILKAALPKLLRQGQAAEFKQDKAWRLSSVGKTANIACLKNAKKQIAMFQLLQQHPAGLTSAELKCHKLSSTVAKGLVEKSILEECWIEKKFAAKFLTPESQLELNQEQAVALAAITDKLDMFQPSLLHGVTGSGKTEVYLQAIAAVIEQGKQCLVLVPEIGLTPQTIDRFQRRFAVPIAVMHSGLNDRERLDAWLMASRGIAPIIIGTRSAIFTPMKTPGMIIIDEEHDGSFKQQDSFRYSARDLAIVRARYENIPIVLGSATPSLETFHNAKAGRYQLLQLNQRVGEAIPPTISFIDIRSQRLKQGLSTKLSTAIAARMKAGEQVLLFINRRGYAPVLMCHACGWVSDCKRCDAHMTLHLSPKYLHCHHCDTKNGLDRACPDCGNTSLMPVGLGTERVEDALKEQFPDEKILRIDRDTTSRKGAMHDLLQDIHSGKSQILIGTQMLAKGHHFPNVTLVAILDADGGLFSADFRATERLAQLLIQVAGRAGREEKPGEVYIQTRHPDHPVLISLFRDGYQKFAENLLTERSAAELPPHGHLALFRAESPNKSAANEFLKAIKSFAATQANPLVHLLGPIPAPMEKRAGRYRMQLLLQSTHRSKLQAYLANLIEQMDLNKLAKQVRWSLDVDPIDLV